MLLLDSLSQETIRKNQPEIDQQKHNTIHARHRNSRVSPKTRRGESAGKCRCIRKETRRQALHTRRACARARALLHTGEPGGGARRRWNWFKGTPDSAAPGEGAPRPRRRRWSEGHTSSLLLWRSRRGTRDCPQCVSL